MIQLNHVSLRYRAARRRWLWAASDSHKTWAVRDLSFRIEPGNVVGIVGMNGAGKSTLLRLMAGIFRPSLGQLTADGRIVPLLSLSCGFELELNGEENIRLSALLWGESADRIAQRTADIAEFSGLGGAIHEPLKTYSSGMLSRLGFAIATSVQTDILLLDEILAVGDGRFQRRCEQRIASLVDSSRIVVVCSHQTNWLKRRCDKIVWLHEGQMRAYGPAEDVADEYEAFLSRP